MKIKSYYSRTVADAIASARAELGEEAMLLNSRKAPIQTRHLGEYEVVFATLAPGEESPEPSALPAEPAANPSPAYNDRLANDVADLKKELENMRRVLTRTAYSPEQFAGGSQDASEAFGTLNAADVSPELARDIVQAAQVRLALPVLPIVRTPHKPDPAAFQRALVEEIASRFTVDAQLGRGTRTPRIVALVGPPGCGKTTTLVKLAVNYGLAARRPVLLLSMDTHRVAAADQLRSYAAILGVGFQVLETVAALAQTIEESRGKELILIDTPGLSQADMEHFSGLSHFLATRDDIDTQLVLPASMKPADLTRMVNAFDCMQPDRLIFTKLDETGSHGPILNEAARTKKPLSFFTTGQRIPEEIEAAAAPRLLELVLGGGRSKVQAA
jgi:flagellar biosynthesis protein FlhF